MQPGDTSDRPAGHAPWAGPGAGRAALAVILVLAFGLRVHRLGVQELRGDEAFGYFFSQPPVGQIVAATLALQEPHPVASYAVQHLWLKLAGESEFALRFLGVCFGVLAVALIYQLGRRLRLGFWSAGLAAGLLAISPYAIWHAQDARMYNISLALTLAVVAAALAALQRPRWPAWAALVALSWLALHTHYFTAFVILALNFTVVGLLWIKAVTPRAARQWLASQVVLALLYLPWLMVAWDTLTGYRGNGASPGFGAMLLRGLAVFAAGESAPAGLRVSLALAAGLLILLGGARLARAGQRVRPALLLLGLYLAVPLLATWISALQRPIFDERYLVAAAPPFFLLAAVAVAGVGQPHPAHGAATPPRAGRLAGWLAAALLIFLLAGMVGSLARFYGDPAVSKTRGWRQLAAALERYSAGWPVDAVRLAQNFPDPTLWYYYRGPVEHLVLPPAAHDGAGAERAVAALAAAGVQRLLAPLQPAAGWDDAGLAQQALDRYYDLALETAVGVWPLRVYQRRPQTVAPLDLPFANGLRLTGAAFAAPPVLPGDALLVYLRWQGEGSELTGSEKLTLQVLDENGRVAAQMDQPFGAADLAAPFQVYSVPLPADLPPGSYRLLAALYDPGQAGAPRLLTRAGADHVELGVISW